LQINVFNVYAWNYALERGMNFMKIELTKAKQNI